VAASTGSGNNLCLEFGVQSFGFNCYDYFLMSPGVLKGYKKLLITAMGNFTIGVMQHNVIPGRRGRMNDERR